MKQTLRNPHSMKQFLAIVATAVAVVSGTTTAAGQGYHLGLTVSPNLSFTDARELSHVGAGGQTHFGYGFIFDAMFTDTYAIGTGVNIFYNGGRVAYFEGASTAEGTVISRVELDLKQQYVEIPLTFKMRTKEIGYSTYFGQFGVGMGLNVRSEGTRVASAFAASDTAGGWAFVNAEPGDPALVSLVDETLLFRPSMIIGLGFERRFTGTTALAVGLRYNMALRNQYQAFPVYQTRDGEDLIFEFDQASGGELPVEGQMRGKTGQIELCVGVMF